MTAFRRAVATDRDDRRARLDLARALDASHDEEAARQVLLSLREQAPEDPEINVRLARLEGRRQDVTAATRYYQNALYGVWSPGQDEARRQLRLELIRFLLDHHQQAQAASEVLALTANLPDDLRSHIESGHLFLEVGDAPRALAQFERALQLDPRNQDALAGAGEEAFSIGDYPRAARYLGEMTAANARLESLRRVADLVLTGDPLESRLSLAERRAWLARALAHSAGRLDTCLMNPDAAGARPDLEALRMEVMAFEPALTRMSLRDVADSMDDGVDLVFRVEKSMAPCVATEEDRALLLIGRRHARES